jgi:uncharacterized protein YqgV (UPF0045/DUF77 family)
MTEIELEEKFKIKAHKVWIEGNSLNELMCIIEECIQETKEMCANKLDECEQHWVKVDYSLDVAISLSEAKDKIKEG